MLTNLLSGIAINEVEVGGIKLDDTPDPTPASPTATLENGVLFVRGSDLADDLFVRQVNNRIFVEGVQISVGGQKVDSIEATSVTQIMVQGNGGNDRISLDSSSLPGGQPILASVSVWGGEGDDVIVGSTSRDYLAGGAGNDRIFGNTGDDVLLGGLGNDYLSGGDGNDRLHGEAGNDFLYGRTGNDMLLGGDGNDYLSGEQGHDSLWGNAGADWLLGATGNDALYGGTGNDALYGQDGNDRLTGEAGLDTLHGGAGIDHLNADRAGEWMTQGEIVRIAVPTDQPQTDGWSCGPNSASRILRSYGYSTATYANVRSAAQCNSLLSRCGLGTTPANLVEVMRKWKGNSQLERTTTLNRVLDILGTGKPVNALIKVGTKSVLGVGYPALHWIALTGFDRTTSRIFYTDTNGGQYQMSFSDFYAKWNWSAGTIAGSILSGLNVTNRTIVY